MSKSADIERGERPPPSVLSFSAVMFGVEEDFEEIYLHSDRAGLSCERQAELERSAMALVLRICRLFFPDLRLPDPDQTELNEIDDLIKTVFGLESHDTDKLSSDARDEITSCENQLSALAREVQRGHEEKEAREIEEEVAKDTRTAIAAGISPEELSRKLDDLSEAVDFIKLRYGRSGLPQEVANELYQYAAGLVEDIVFVFSGCARAISRNRALGDGGSEDGQEGRLDGAISLLIDLVLNLEPRALARVYGRKQDKLEPHIQRLIEIAGILKELEVADSQITAEAEKAEGTRYTDEKRTLLERLGRFLGIR